MQSIAREQYTCEITDQFADEQLRIDVDLELLASCTLPIWHNKLNSPGLLPLRHSSRQREEGKKKRFEPHRIS